MRGSIQRTPLELRASALKCDGSLFPLATSLQTQRTSNDSASNVVILRLAGGQSAALIVGQEPGIACRLSGPTAQRQCSLGQRPRTFENEAPQAVGLAQCVERDLLRAFSPEPLWLSDLGRCPRLHCGRAVGAERLSPTGRFIGSLRRACPASVEGISRGGRGVCFSPRIVGADGPSWGVVSFENGE